MTKPLSEHPGPSQHPEADARANPKNDQPVSPSIGEGGGPSEDGLDAAISAYLNGDDPSVFPTSEREFMRLALKAAYAIDSPTEPRSRLSDFHYLAVTHALTQWLHDHEGESESREMIVQDFLAEGGRDG